MVDTFSLVLMHALLALAAWRLLLRDDLDVESSGGDRLDPGPPPPEGPNGPAVGDAVPTLASMRRGRA